MHRFISKDGKEVVLRTPIWEDINGLMEVTNSIVDEGIDIATSRKVTRKEEAEWLRQRLALTEKGEVLGLVAEIEGKMVARSELRKRTGRYSKHVGNIGIGIRKGYRGVGIGTEMMKVLIAKAETMGLKMIDPAVASSNKRAIHVYEKVGFKKTGRIPKFYYKDGKYFDEIIMAKEIESS